MAKTRTGYLCRSCGNLQTRWMGKCPDCGEWDGLEPWTEPSGAAESSPEALAAAWRTDEGDGQDGDPAATVATPLPEITTAETPRLPTGLDELDRVLGGGLVPGSVVLLGGDPGIGKSTLMLQAAAALAGRGRRVLYVSSEESARQTRLRADRLFREAGPLTAEDLDQLYILADTSLLRIAEQARRLRPDVCIIDSIQMVHRPDLDGAAGSVPQLRRCSADLVGLAKLSGMIIILVGHVTKDGQLAGPRLLEHLVDVVLAFDGDQHHAHRVVHGIKNRFGPTMEVGLFEMTGSGLAEVHGLGPRPDPGAAPRPGSVICPVMQGTRCLLVELQALTARGFPGNSARRTSGVDPKRLAMLIAVLEQHGGLRLSDQDVFASAVGGLRVVEPAADLALALAIAGAHHRRGLPPATAVLGEVGLGGEIRPVSHVEARVHTAVRRGHRQVLIGSGQTPPGDETGACVEVPTIGAALEWLERQPAERADPPIATAAR